MMYCTFCKKQIEDDALFCPYCGKSTPQGDALAELAAAARTGDQDAIGALYEKTYSKVYYTVKSMIRDEDAVFDIVQDTYIKAFAHLDSFQGDTKFLPWVRQIAANTARDWLKKKRPMLFAELSADDGQDTPVEELFQDERSNNLPDQIIDQKETKRLIHEIIEELPEDQRAAIGMFYYEEMSVKEIAAAMGVSESAVKSRLMYGRNKIEKKVLELEKRGTKLYSLSPLPFLLLLFRSQKAYACEAPDGRILDAVLASRPTGSAAGAGAARGADVTGKAAGAGTAGANTAKAAAGAGTAGTGAAAAAGGLSALKIGLIALAVLAVVGLGAFGAVQIASRSSGPQQSPTGHLVGQKEPEAPEEPESTKEPEALVEPTATKEPEAPVETKDPTAPVEPEATKEPEATEEPSFPASYIFSDMPIAAYEVTGLGVGLNEEVYAEHAIDPETGKDYGVVPFVKLDSSNTFVLFCMRDDLVIQSPSGSSQWEANKYTNYFVDENVGHSPYPKIEGYASGDKPLLKSSGSEYSEAANGGRIPSWLDIDLQVFMMFEFSEIYHPDASQEDTIHVLAWSEWDEDYYKRIGGEIQERIVSRLKSIGATNVQEISVEEALKKSHITVPGAAETEYGPEDKSCTSYVIPDGVTEIAREAFAGCSALTSIEIPNSVTKIGSRAFDGCSSLTSIEIPDSVTYIGDHAFIGCSGLSSIELPNSVMSIEAWVFADCSGLSSIEIPDSVTQMGTYAFAGCSSLSSIEIPDSVMHIFNGLFYGCSSLTSIKIPDGVRSISEYAFSGCESLTSIELPNSVVKIESSAFEGCSGLTSIEIPNSVTEIYNKVFSGCSSLTSIEIPKSVWSIGRNAFNGCSSLKTIKVPQGMDVSECGLGEGVQVIYY